MWFIGGCVFGFVVLYLLWPLSIPASHLSSKSTFIIDRNGVLLREIRPEGKGVWLPLDRINPFAIEALIAIEDRNYYTHKGIDPRGLVRALHDNVKAGRVVSGASTITMQVARIRSGHVSRSLVNKLHEVALAIRLEIHLSKADILTEWLNNAYFGNQAYGIEAAAQLYFGKPALDLTNSEAAFLIGLPQNPVGYNPYRFINKALSRHSRVLHSMVDTGGISPDQIDTYFNVPVQIIPKEDAFLAPHFVEWIQSTSDDTLFEHATMTTSLDATLQSELEALARGHLNRLDSEYVTNAAAIVLDNYTGEILAYMGSVDYWNDQIEGQNDGVRMLRQPGSTLKPFTYALALESKAYTAASVLPDIEVQIPAAGGAFAPKNYDKTYHGPVPLRHALANSYNVPAVRLTRDLGVPQLLHTLRNVGFNSLNRTPSHYGVGLTLGNGEVQLIELARAYALFARQGQSLELRYTKNPATQSQLGTPLISPEVTYLITHILADHEAREAAFGRHGPLELPFPTAVKTGTSKDYRDNWAVGFTPRHTVAVWVGNFDGSPMQKVSGVSGAGPLLKSIVQYLGSSGEFKEPDNLEQAVICPLSGQKPASACPVKKRERFIPGTVPLDTCTVHQHILLDTRSHLLATTSTPKSFVRPTIFSVLPPIYHPWMRKQGLVFPPTESHSEEDPLPETLQPSDVQIAYPISGMIFQLDPVLRPEYQQIRLEGIVVPDKTDGTSWWINETLWAQNTASTLWPLQKGIHTIEFRNEGGNRGAVIQIEVVD